ncbi:tyrosine-type recombinase/integrase [Desulforhopalus sp. 52FAK]
MIRETLARVSEINRLIWDDISFKSRYVTLYTRKKSGGHLPPRRIWMTDKLYTILTERFTARTDMHPWVFWHRYYSRKEGCWKEGPYGDRKKIMKSLCAIAGVPYFRFHALRHAGGITNGKYQHAHWYYSENTRSRKP